MSLPLTQPFLPMEALSAREVPRGANWQYEPKWDGFRCLAFRDGETVELQSKAGQPLTRYFPEMVEAARALKARKFVLDGEIVIPVKGGLSFDDLLQRIHPAESRVRRLSAETPAIFVVFDILADERGKSLVQAPLRERRRNLEAFAAEYFPANGRVRLSPATPNVEVAQGWFRRMGGGLDGIIAKNLDSVYEAGERTGSMQKIKEQRTADCVVGGFRYASKGKLVGSLLLGLYDDAGLLQHVGFTSAIRKDQKKALTSKLEKLIQPPGFTGRAPGGPSRWSTDHSTEWQPLRPELVVEVGYDHFTGGRFRHGTRFLRWRPDKAPEQCRMEQVERESRSPLGLLAS